MTFHRAGLAAGVAVVLCALSSPLPAQETGGAAPALEILIPRGAVYENSPSQWAVVLGRRPMGTTGGVDHELPVEFRWDFGEGLGTISTGERPSLEYDYRDDGEKTVRVEAWSGGSLWAVGTRTVNVHNRRPFDLVLSAVEIDPETATFEMTADVDDTPADALEYVWDFGDGSEPEHGADHWRVEHAYPKAGTYTVTVTVRDDHGQEGERVETMVVRSYAAGEGVEDTVEPLAGAPPAEAVTTRFEAQITGDGLTTPFDGEVRPFAGIFLGPLDHGARCRFMFTAWDAPHLAFVTVIADLAGLPESGGARYTFHPARTSVNFYPTAAEYLGARKTAQLMFTDRGFGDLLAEQFPNLSPQARADTKALGGVDPRPREPSGPQPEPAATSPFGIDDHEGFEAKYGDLGFTFYPHDRAVGTFNLALLNTDERSPYKQINLTGDFSIDLEAAQRDGMMLYDRCGPAELSIEEVSPEPDTRFVYSRTPRVRVVFSDAYDPDTVDETTVQLTYPAAGSGAPTPVEARFYRRRSSFFLEPVEPLWGGVYYTARVKTGEAGVRGRNGAALADEDGSGWYSWTFSTRVDLTSKPGEPQHLSCHVFQSSRDVPLIAGKAAVARIYAHWPPDPRVLDTAQEVSLNAHVVLVDGTRGVAAADHEFIRPDLWQPRAEMMRQAVHTANVFFRPDGELSDTLRVEIALAEKPGEEPEVKHRTLCATPSWNRSPTLDMVPFLVVRQGWRGSLVPDPPEKALGDIRQAAGMGAFLAESMLPVHHIHVRPPTVLVVTDDATESQILGMMATRTPPPDPDLIIGFVPAGGDLQSTGPYGGPVALQTLDVDYPETSYHPLVRHLAYTLGLSNGPYQPSAAGLSPGIEGFRLVDGRAAERLLPALGAEIDAGRITGINKSSSEGNGEGDQLAPLMIPDDRQMTDVFLSRAHYLDAMEWLEGQEP
ncbi:MAG: PKD domain-containing protein [Thermoanaerobaculia bacterium]